MKNSYHDLIEQTFDFPQHGFEVIANELYFYGIPLMDLVRSKHTPIRLTYLPVIEKKIENARRWFSEVFEKLHYSGKYHYCYCTKSNHFSHVLEKVISCGAQIETSAAFDIDLIWRLYENNKIDKRITIIHNGFKPERYLRRIADLQHSGFVNSLPVCDNMEELLFYENQIEGVVNIGLRLATEEEPNFEFYTSRLGIPSSEILSFYRQRIHDNDKVRLRMLHFFVDKGIRDSIYYWGELQKAIDLYCKLRIECPHLQAINIGGGLPIKNSLGFDYDYAYMIHEIVQQIHAACVEARIPEPDIYTEFGKYTVGDTGAHLFTVLAQKPQNDSELWYMIDNSLMNTIPDAWGIGERFVMLPLNKWNHPYTRANIGGISCDNSDYYNSEVHQSQVYLPKYQRNEAEPLYIGFFHTGAYQDSLSGYGGLQHCLIPSPKQVIVDRDEHGKFNYRQFAPEQNAEQMMRILGYI